MSKTRNADPAAGHPSASREKVLARLLCRAKERQFVNILYSRRLFQTSCARSPSSEGNSAAVKDSERLGSSRRTRR